MLHGLYVLTDSRLHPYSEWPDRTEQAILGGANVIQLRDKHLSDLELLPYALFVREICSNYHVPFIVNDRIELAQQVRADGVHLGKYDNSLRATRDYLGSNYFIGVSCYNNLFNAVQAQKLGANYIAFGSIFSSSTKQNAPRCSLSVISCAKHLLDIPICAIGGITSNNVSHVINAGASLIAATHSVFNAHDPMTAANKLNQQVIMRR